jgi:site-specific DNA recombinase
MQTAVIYARVSSREQEREGYSIPAQRKLLNGYAHVRGFRVQQEFIDVESAKNPGRKEFGKMLRLLASDPECRTVLVEKTDRLYRNRTDSIAFEELIENRKVEIHLVKEGRVIAKDSRSQDKFMHDIHVAVAKHYSENLREEVKKGMREKAEQGLYPGRAPFGYKNNSATRNIEVDPQRAPILRKIFEMYASGQYSLTTLREAVVKECGIRINRSYLENLLKTPFYIGHFVWGGEKIQPSAGLCLGETQDAKEAEIAKRAIQVGHYARRHGLKLQCEPRKSKKTVPRSAKKSSSVPPKRICPQIFQTRSAEAVHPTPN